MIRKIKHIIEFAALLSFISLMRLMPLWLIRFKARRLADFAFFILRIRRKVVIDNLRQAFKDKKSPEIRKIALNAYRQFAQTFFEILSFPRFRKEDVASLVTIKNRELLDLALKLKKGGVLVGSHFGNWELMGAAVALYYPTTFIIGEQSNRLVDELLNSYRRNKGIKLIPFKFALRGVIKALKNNEFIAILSDQDAHRDGVFVNFFNRPASTPRAPALFALRAGCPILVGHCIRHKGKFEVVFETVPKPQASGDEQKDVENYTQAYCSILEKYITMHPDHWFWMHKRWKTRPAP